VPVPEPQPLPQPGTPPAAPNLLRIALSGDSWQEAPRYVVLLDGVQQGGERAVQASREAGEQEMITLSGDFASHSAAVTIRFLNDAWGGNAGADRNLYVEGMWLDGVNQGKTASLLQNGDAVFQIAPAPVPAPADTRALAISLSGQSWAGQPIAIVLVDGQERFRGEIAAQHGQSTEWHALGDVSRTKAHDITVRFSNDAWGGHAAADRNLYIDALFADGVPFGSTGELLINGDFNVHLAAVSAQPVPQPIPQPIPQPVPQPVPPPMTPVAVPNLLKIALSGDSWQEAPRYLILINGVQQGGEGTVHASHAAGANEVLTLAGDFSNHTAAVTIRFVNDAWGGHAGADRNLYVEGIWLDGVNQGKTASLLQNGDAVFQIAPGPPVVQSQGAGPDSLRVMISQDAWQGDARFLLLVDGVQMGGEHAAQASRAVGEAEIWELRGNFIGSQPNQLAVRFLNDGWGGDASQDRNLYVEHLALNGSDLHAQASLFGAGDAVFGF